jgi:hypothetical protein
MGVAVSKGFLVFAQNTDKVDYVQQAYALALSIRASQTSVKDIAIVTNDSIPEEYKFAFNEIIPIPWVNDNVDNATSIFSAEHRWKLYHITPYDETIVLDTDMLLLEDITSWWEYCNDYNIKFCSKIRNYKLDEIKVDIHHRKTFIANKLTNPYFALHYFKKSQQAHDFYKVLEFVCNNWQGCYGIFAPEYYQKWLSMDLATAIAIELSGMYEIIDNFSPLEFIHMKIPLQGWPVYVDSWQDAVPFVLNTKGELVVGNIKQTKLFHYVEKNFITKTLLSRLEDLANV